MPNWCLNYLNVTGHNGQIEEIRDAFCKETPFERLIGSPQLDSRLSAIEKYGTKWDIQPCEPSDIHYLKDGMATFSVSFETAWSPPMPFLVAMCEKYNVSATMEYEEPGCDFAGTIEVNGDGSLCDRCFTYLEGIYRQDEDRLWDVEINDLFENAKNVEEVMQRLSFLTDDEKARARDMYAEYSVS